ncbi:MAG: HEAT repeat domain-containing protein, partial [Candidatus Paceibacterales bacterium]
YDDAAKKEQVIINQTQDDKVFKLPVAVDIYEGGNKVRYQIWAKNKVDTFYFDAAQKPDLVNFDGDKILLTEKKENKTLGEYIYQYKYAGSYLDRREAIDFASKKQDDPIAVDFLKIALKDKYEGLRNFTIGKLDMKKDNVKQAVEPVLADLVKNDPKRSVKASAIAKLGQYKKPEYASLFKAAVNDSSYTVAGDALDALSEIDSASALAEAKRLSKEPSKGQLANSITGIMIKSGDESSANTILNNFEKLPLSQAKFNLLQSIGVFLGKTKDMDIVKRGIDDIVTFRDAIPEAFKGQTDPFINGVLLKGLVTQKKDAGLQEQSDYIKSKLPEEDKKGF